MNTTYFNFEQTCGFNNCPIDVLPESSSDPTKTSVYILLGILLFINFLGILTTIFFIDEIYYEKNANLDENKTGMGKTRKIKYII